MAKNNVFEFIRTRGASTEYTHELACRWLKCALDLVPFGEYVIKIERIKRDRSLDQNALMWKWFTVIAYEWTELSGSQYTKDDAHNYYCSLFLPELFILPTGNSILQSRLITKSTSSLSKEEMTEFLNKVQADAATEWGIRLPNRDDLWFDEWRKIYNI